MKLYRAFIIVAVLPLALMNAQDETDQDTDLFAEQKSGELDLPDLVDGVVSNIGWGVDHIAQFQWEDDTDAVRQEPDDISEPSADAVTFNGDTEIAEDDTIQGDLIVKYGTLTVRGCVNGDVLVVNGNIIVASTGHIKGNARAMNGTIVKRSGAIVDGFTEQSSDTSTPRRKRTQRIKYSYSFRPYDWVGAPFVDDNFVFRYNRAEGLYLGFGAEKRFYWDGSRIISGYGTFGYGFAMHRWRLQLGLDRQFATSGDALYEIGTEGHSITDTKDEWLMKLSENNIAALLLREDYRDYYQREGFSVHGARYSKGGGTSTMIDVRYLNDRYETMWRETNWSVFGTSRSFRDNPAVNEGIMKSVAVSAGVSTVEKYRDRSEGWDVYGRAEYGGKEFGGDFDFNQAILDVRRFQQLSDDDQISLRVRAGSLEGDPLVQKMFELGGANTMPAYGFKEFSGNRMILGNLEYQLDGEVIDEWFIWPGSLNLILFTDAGAVTGVAPTTSLIDGFDALTVDKVRSDFGFGFGWTEAGARLGFAWRTDKQAPVAIFLRLNRAF